MSNISIVLAEDHHIVRQGLRLLLEAVPRFSIVGESADGVEAVRLVERLEPDILILDLMLPMLNGLGVLRQICRGHLRTQVIVLSMYREEAYVFESLRCGARGYVFKDSSSSDLVRAIDEVVAGRRYLSLPILESSIEAYMERIRQTPLDRLDLLSNREREVLQMTAEGLTAAEIAHRLFVSPRTVEAHRASMMRKLRLQSPIDLLRFAVANGILPVA